MGGVIVGKKRKPIPGVPARSYVAGCADVVACGGRCASCELHRLDALLRNTEHLLCEARDKMSAYEWGLRLAMRELRDHTDPVAYRAWRFGMTVLGKPTVDPLYLKLLEPSE